MQNCRIYNPGKQKLFKDVQICSNISFDGPYSNGIWTWPEKNPFGLMYLLSYGVVRISLTLTFAHEELIRPHCGCPAVRLVG